MKKGFTLIELLVVVSIIALLASILLSSLTVARNQAYDNSVKAGMKELSAQIELIAGKTGFDAGITNSQASGNGVTGGTCNSGGSNGQNFNTSLVFTNLGVQAIFANMIKNGAAIPFRCAINSTGNKWAVSVNSLKGTGLPWCIDNSGGFKGGAGESVITDDTNPSFTGMCP